MRVIMPAIVRTLLKGTSVMQFEGNSANEQHELVNQPTIVEEEILAEWEAHAGEFAARIDSTLAELVELINAWNSLTAGPAAPEDESTPVPDRYRELKDTIQSFLDTSPQSG